ncbi:MAG: LpqB family beta-propeller domain-containing protein [Thermoanaerobaculia bacterium]
MSLAAGTRLGHYEILSPLGAGGMGEVYRARDTRLGREVAVKVLPAAVSANPERLRRFEKEARSASALNHPHIVTIHDIGESGGTAFIAMELVDGQTLRELLAEGALPTKRLLTIAAQVADGLAKAHGVGIVHRDLKPENVMVSQDGFVKILDFGLAKLTQPEGSSGATAAPTVSGATEPGIVMGTIGYMSPEQAAGRALDFRSDQFAFGSILYEMATGKRAFQRGSAPQTMAAIIQDEPDSISALNPRVPAPLRWIIERCLAKEPRSRYTSTEDLAKELATIRDRLSEATSAVSALPSEPAPVRQRRWWIPAVLAPAVLVIAGVTAWRLRRADDSWKNPLADARYTRFTDWEGSELDAAISPDGKFVAFLSDRDGPFDAWVSQVGSGEFLNLSKGRYPDLVNPQTRNVGFSGDGAHVWLRILEGKRESVWLVPTMGGTPRPFLPDAVQPVWSPDRSHVLYHSGRPGDPMFIADGNGSNAKQIFIEKPGIHNHFPTWSPDGRFVYFVHGVPPQKLDIWRIPSSGGVAERLTHHNSRVVYPALLDGRTLIYALTRDDGSGSHLYAMDVERRIPHAVTSGLEEYASVSASGDGRHLVATVTNPTRTLWTAPISDRVVKEAEVGHVAVPTVRAASPRFGPDYLLYLSSRGGAAGLWKFREGAGTELWRGSDGAVAAAPAISADGTQVAFVVRTEGRTQLFLISSDGTNAHRIAESLDVSDSPSWSPDGKWIAVVASEGQAQPLLKVPVAGGAPVRLVDGVISDPVWSPDGRFVLYTDNQAGARAQLRGVTPDKRPFPLPEVWVWTRGNRYRFLPDGKSLVVMQGMQRRQDFWLLDLATGRLRQLTDLSPGFETKSFDVSTDGKQILFDRYRENSDIVLIDLPPR